MDSGAKQVGAAREAGDSAGGRRAHYVLIVCTLLFMVNWMDRQVLAAVLQPMKVALGLSDTEAGSLQTVFFLGMAAFSLPVSFLVDRWSRRKAVGLMALVWSAFTFATGLGRSYLGVLFPRAVVGVGEAAFAAGGTAWITGVYPPASRGRAMGIFYLFTPLGTSLGFVLGGLISQRMGGWYYPFFVFAIPGVILGTLAFFLTDYRTVVHVDERGKRTGFVAALSGLLKVPTLRWLYLAWGLKGLMIYSLVTWTAAYLMRSRGVAEDRAGMTMGVILLMGVLGPLIGGVLADKWQETNPRARMLLNGASDLLGAVCAISALLLNVEGVGYVLMCIWSVMALLGFPALSAVTQDVADPAFKALSYGVGIFVSYLVSGAWGPVAVGAISDALGGGAEGLRTALIVICLAGFVAAFFNWLGSRTYQADLQKVAGASTPAPGV
jgi:MFS family permease